jgi:threonine dehydrogenase-like Zn-dependent dehydrogenase
MRVTAWVVCVIAGRIEKLSGGPGVDVVLEMAGDPDLICTAFDIVRCNGRIFLLATEGVPNCRLTVETSPFNS